MDDTGEWISLVKLAAAFGLVMFFGYLQIRSLDKLDEEDALKKRDETLDD